jgi:hypothetical protein
MNDIDNDKITNDTTELIDDGLDLEVQELEDRFTPGAHGVCVCSTTCNCTSCSCVVVF